MNWIQQDFDLPQWSLVRQRDDGHEFEDTRFHRDDVAIIQYEKARITWAQAIFQCKDIGHLTNRRAATPHTNDYHASRA